MEKNQNDHRNHASDSKTNQPAKQDGNKKEINPNNPTATQDKNRSSMPTSQKGQGSASPHGKSGQDVAELEEETTEEATSDARKTSDSKTSQNAK